MLRPLLFAFFSLSTSAQSPANPPPPAIIAETLANPAASAAALHDAGDAANRARQYPEARQLFRRASDLGHARSKARLASLLNTTLGGPRDAAAARALFLEAAQLGDVAAMSDFARLASMGIGGPVDGPAAIAWAEKAVENGNVFSHQTLGLIHEEGRGVPRDLAKAREWYERGRAKNDIVSRDSATRLRLAVERTPEQKLAAYQTALSRVADGPNAPRDRGRAFWNYYRSLYDGGLSPEESAALVRPALLELAELDFHAIPSAISHTSNHLRPGLEVALTADQRRIVRQIWDHQANRSRPAPEIQPGQAWSAVYSADKRPAVAVAATPAPRPATPAATPAPAVTAKPAPRPAAPAAASTSELSAVTRDATNWQEFFAASARRGTAFHLRHETDVKLFLQRHPADAGQLRTAYRAAVATLQPTPGTDRGSEAGAQFVAYLLAVRASGLAASAVIPWVRDDFLNLSRADTYYVHGALMGVPDPDVSPLRALLPAHQNTEVGAIAARVTRREPLPKVSEPAAVVARAPATTPAIARAASSAAPAPTDPVAALTALYPRFIETLNARKSGVAFTADEQAVFANLASLLPLAAKQTNDAFQRERDQRDRSSPGAALLNTGITAHQEKRYADALAAWEQAAAAGHAAAKINLALVFATDREGVPALPLARRQALLAEADATGHPVAAPAMVSLLLGAGSTDEAAKWARTAVERGHPEGGYTRYFVLLRQRLALARDPLRALEISRSNQFNAQREELKEALAALTDSALRGQGIAMYELARYHHRGGLPGIRPTFTFERPEHNLHLARFWFDQAIKVDAQRLNESLRVSIPATIADIDRALAAAKGREWSVDEIVAALESGLASDDLAWLLAREGGAYSQSQYNRLLASEALKKVPEHSLLRDKLAGMVLIGPGPETRALAAAAIAERRRTVSPLPAPGDDLAELRRRFEAGDPAAAYALLLTLPARNKGDWPEDAPPAARVREVAVSRDYAPAQYLRIRLEQLEGNDPAKRDPSRAFALALSSARAGSAEAARLVANYYREHRGESPVRANFAEAEWWYAQAAALAWPDQFQGIAGLDDPERNLASLYQFQSPGIAGGITFDPLDPATHRWVRELRRRGGDFKKLADEQVAYFGTTDAGNHDLDKLVAALPPELPPIAPAELARLERDADAGQPEALRTLARALAHGEGGLRQDDTRAAALYRRAAEAGDREAMTALAEMLDKGHGVPRDLVATREWRARAEGKPVDRATLLIEAAQSAARNLRTHPLVEPYLLEAVDLGSEEARHQLAFYLMQGRPLKKDTERALRLYTEAAEAGHAPAMASLAFAYGEGKDLPKDAALSHRWRVRAAEAGHLGSRTLLAYHFNRGTNGAPLDKKQALHWARLVAPEDRSIRENLLPLLEREVAEATPTDPGAVAFARTASLTGDAKLAALREAAQHAHLAATEQLIELLEKARLWHEAHWWTLRPHMLDRVDAAARRALIERHADFKVAKVPEDAASTARDEPLEKSLPILAEALQRAGQDRRRLIAQLDQIIDRHPDRAEPLIAKAQLTLNQTAAARDLLDRAVQLAPAHPQAHALLARLDSAEGRPHRAYYRMRELAINRPDSLQIASSEAELLHLLGGSPRERQALRTRLVRLLPDAPPPDRFAGFVAAAKLAAGMEAWAEAEADLTAAFQLNRDPRVLLERAQVRERIRAYPGAIEDYTAVLASPLAQNPQQAAQLRARIAAVRQAMDTETARLRDETAKIDVGLERVREANSPEARQRIGDRMGAAMDFVAGNRAFEAGDLAKARELWTKAAAAGHEEAAARLKTLPPPQP